MIDITKANVHSKADSLPNGRGNVITGMHLESNSFRTLIDTTDAKVDGRQRHNMRERQVRTIDDK